MKLRGAATTVVGAAVGVERSSASSITIMSEPNANAGGKKHDNLKLPTRTENFSEWYNELVHRAKLADHSDVRGSMVIRPNGYAIWENMQRVGRWCFGSLDAQHVPAPEHCAGALVGVCIVCLLLIHLRVRAIEVVQ